MKGDAMTTQEKQWAAILGVVLFGAVLVWTSGCKTNPDWPVMPPLPVPPPPTSTTIPPTPPPPVAGEPQWLYGPDQAGEVDALRYAADRLGFGALDLSLYRLSSEHRPGQHEGDPAFGWWGDECQCYAWNETIRPYRHNLVYFMHPRKDLDGPAPWSLRAHEQAHSIIESNVSRADREPVGAGHPVRIRVGGVWLNVPDALEVRWPARVWAAMPFTDNVPVLPGDFVCPQGDDVATWGGR